MPGQSCGTSNGSCAKARFTTTWHPVWGVSSSLSCRSMSSYREIKAECYEANLLLPEYRLIDLTFGNVSVADHRRGVFAIKPSGVDYRRMKPEDMVVVDLDGRTVEGSLRPSSDTPTHRRLFQVFTSVRAIVHT